MVRSEPGKVWFDFVHVKRWKYEICCMGWTAVFDHVIDFSFTDVA
jgi:hypothetical protein